MDCDCSRSGVRGLANCGLSCCVNALLQSFAVTTELLELLNRWEPSNKFDDRNVPLQLKKAFEAMSRKQQSNPHLGLLNCLHRYNIHRYTQHDADEVFHAILTLIQEQVADPDLAAKIKSLYKITVEGQIKCSVCENIHKVPTFFVSLPLHIPEHQNTLENCFSSFFRFQDLEPGEAIYCDTCEQKTQSAQGFKLDVLPSLLCIQLKRFRNRRGFIEKLNTKICFPEILKIADVLAKENCSAEVLHGSYRLYGVIVHHGTALFGHYSAFIYSTDKWYYVDDSFVQWVNWEFIQKSYGGIQGDTAYMLFYRKCSSEMMNPQD
ncbi:ubl carboxyl-terminal hydrolase 18 [Trichomycterus rosablanca]|uniref:ubl carboxyl-terminal hydrolase 18 n=1 Tax=Trichomycterus rosablanca TaxID=2290929 RepID=UPI002F3554D6